MIEFYFEDITELQNLDKNKYLSWINKICNLENKKLEEVSIIFTSDDYLLKVNQEYLNHDYYTDIITFDYTEENYINGDLFISLDRVEENARLNNVSFINELNRVIIHGILHLCGYKDKTPNEEQLMRQKENLALELF